MSAYGNLESTRAQRTLSFGARLLLNLQIDGPLLIGLCLAGAVGIVVLYSASGRNFDVLQQQGFRFGLALLAMCALARVSPRVIRTASPWVYLFGLVLLIIVMLTGDVAMGAQRWLNLGVVRFQPSEMMKLAVPLAAAWYLHERPLPPSLPAVLVVAIIILVPTVIIAEQPDLGTGILVAAAGGMVVVMAGMRLRYMLSALALLLPVAYIAWAFLMRDYQRQRILTLFDPQKDPLGTGYHIIQSQIAIGSGGVFGKGYLRGSQAQLEFLPERSTDFIFAVIGEEWGLVGLTSVLLLYVFIVGRALYLAATAPDTFARLGAGSLALTFSVYVLVNAGMVTGLLPVVGVPLPLISFGGTSMVALMAGFGIVMALSARRKLVSA